MTSTITAGHFQAGHSLDQATLALQRARTILNHGDADAAPALALELVATGMPTDAALTALGKALSPTDLITTAKAMGLA